MYPRLALRFLSGPHQGAVVPLDPAVPLVIGRHDGADVVVKDELVSRRHVRVAFEADGLMVEDLGSTNGTFLNGNRVRRSGVSEGDRILVGGCLMKVVSADAPMAPAFALPPAQPRPAPQPGYGQPATYTSPPAYGPPSTAQPQGYPPPAYAPPPAPAYAPPAAPQYPPPGPAPRSYAPPPAPAPQPYAPPAGYAPPAPAPQRPAPAQVPATYAPPPPAYAQPPAYPPQPAYAPPLPEQPAPARAPIPAPPPAPIAAPAPSAPEPAAQAAAPTALAAPRDQAMQGRLEDVPVPQVLTILGSTRKTGLLVMFCEGHAAEVRFEGGRVTGCVVDGRTDIAPAKSLQRLLAWKAGTFELRNVSAGGEPNPSAGEAVETLLADGLQQLEDLARILPRLPSRVGVTSSSTDLDALDPDDRDILVLAAQNSHVQDILDATRLSDLRAAQRIAALITRGLLVSFGEASSTT